MTLFINRLMTWIFGPHRRCEECGGSGFIGFNAHPVYGFMDSERCLRCGGRGTHRRKP